jgi:hypothetical protein
MKAVPLAAAVLCAAAVSHATTLVAVWSPEQLLIGADSAVITEAGGFAIQGSACKIVQDQKFYFAFSGLVDEPSIKYNAEALAHRAMVEGGTLETRINRFIELTNPQLVAALEQVKRDTPEQYAFLQQGHPALQAIFAQVQDGPATLATVGFSVGPNGTVSPSAKVIANGDDGRGPRIIYAGQQSRIREYLRDHRDWFQDDQAELIRRLIGLEIAGSDGEVGGAIDILRLKPSAAEWVQRKAQCGTT